MSVRRAETSRHGELPPAPAGARLSMWSSMGVPATSGLAMRIICCGSTSGTPPTRVLTTSRPQLAASTMAMQNASVNDVLRKMWPFTSTYAGAPGVRRACQRLQPGGARTRPAAANRTSRTSECFTAPMSSTRSCSWYFSRICSRSMRLGPSPPAAATCPDCCGKGAPSAPLAASYAVRRGLGPADAPASGRTMRTRTHQSESARAQSADTLRG